MPYPKEEVRPEYESSGAEANSASESPRVELSWGDWWNSMVWEDYTPPASSEATAPEPLRTLPTPN